MSGIGRACEESSFALLMQLGKRGAWRVAFCQKFFGRLQKCNRLPPMQAEKCLTESIAGPMEFDTNSPFVGLESF